MCDGWFVLDFFFFFYFFSDRFFQSNDRNMNAPQPLQVRVDEAEKIAVVSLNRPQKLNSINHDVLIELKRVFDRLADDERVNAIVFRGEGKHFSSGIDVGKREGDVLMGMGIQQIERERCKGRRSEYLLRHVRKLQECVNAIESCRKVVVCSIKGFCLGGGLDLAACTDIRLASESAKFAVMETEVGIVADIGSLQRLPHIIGWSRTAELAFTARLIDAREALEIGLVSRIEKDVDAAALDMAKKMARMSPLAVQGTKQALLNARDSASVREGLDYVALKNAAQLVSDDLAEAMRSKFQKRVPNFAKL